MKYTKTILRKKFLKKKYISIMYNTFHKNLYKYREIIKNTLVESVTITSKDVLFSIKDSINEKNLSQEKQIIIKGVEDDLRIAPIEILNFRTYENKEIYITSEIIKKILFKKSVNFFDIGANIGFYSLKLYKKFNNYKNKIKIYAFEPVKSTFKYLQENINLNRIKSFNGSGIFINNFGFSNEKKTLKLHFNSKNSVNASLKKLTNNQTKLIRCNFSILDNFCIKNKIIPDFIKADVEGMELFVVQGAKELIKKHKPVFFLEILNKFCKKYNYSPNLIFNFFYQNDYSAYTFAFNKKGGLGIKRFITMTQKTTDTNFLFLSNTKHKTIKDSLLF